MGNESTAVLRKEYDSLSEEYKRWFLELAAKQGLEPLQERQFWRNFAILCDFLERKEKVRIEKIRAGYYTYSFLRKRLETFGKKERMAAECQRFYDKVCQIFTIDFYDILLETDGKLSADEINIKMEAFVKNMMILLANKAESESKEIQLLHIDDYSWGHFIHDVETGLRKKGYLVARRRGVLSDMQEDKLAMPLVKDTYIYTVILLYFIKNVQERWKE